MSIPKEPRQLMINIMYLVLTALLALNVSAEIFNAFKLVDKGLVTSNAAMDAANEPMKATIEKAAKAKASYAQYAERVDPVRETSAEMSAYIQSLVDTMVQRTNGYVVDDETGETTDELRGKKNFDITTLYLVGEPTGEPGVVTGKAQELKERLVKYSEDILQYVDEDQREEYRSKLAINIDDETWKKKNKASWAHMNFDHMPLQATLPIFHKYINDVKATESEILNYLAVKVGAGKEDVVLDKFTVVSAPEKSYIIKGEKYSAEVFLTAFAGGDSKTKVSISVDGKSLPLDKDGKGTYTTTPGSLGTKKYTAKATVFNPVTGKTDTYNRQFTYEVGERAGTISASKMNVFYIGVDNPVEVAISGVNSNNINVNMQGGTISRAGGAWNVRVTKPGKATVTASADGFTKSAEFRVKRIPDPVPKLSKSRGGAMGSGEFKVQPGVFPVLENFDFDAKCDIAGYRVVRVPKRQDPQVVVNRGGKYSGEAQSLIKKATPGDRYFYEDIKCKCPGDPAPRDIGSMVFNIR